MKKIIYWIMGLIAAFSMAMPVYAEQAEPSPGETPTVQTESAGQGETCTHSFGGWTAAGDSHTRSCTLCGHTETAGHTLEEHVVKAPNCAEAGSKTVSCAVCGYSRTEEIPAAGHSYTLQNADSSNHKQVCSVCGSEQTAPHAWTSQGLDPAPTCTEAGTEHFGCFCGAVKTESVPAKGHSFGPWDGDETTHTRACTACGQEESGTHTWDSSGTVIVPPTCISEGVRGHLCGGCDMVLLEEIPMLTTHTYDNDCDSTCNICGAVREAGHRYTKTYAKNASGHWYTCRVCGAKVDYQAHVPGPAATEEKAQLCLVCGYVMTAKRNHVHKFEEKWSQDESGHWHACDGCEIQEDLQEHVYDNPCAPLCNICGYQNQNAHQFDGSWLSDEAGHWEVCSLCGEESEHQPHVPDAEGDSQQCKVCSFVLAQEHTHSPGEDWMSDEDTHWSVCACGEILDQAPHIWDEGTADAEEKVITYTCAICQRQRTEPAPQKAGGSILWVFCLLGFLALAGIAALIVLLLPKKKAGKFTRQ